MTPRVALKLTALPPAIRRLTLTGAAVDATRAVGRAVAELVRRHLVAKNAEGNKRGWPSTNFYGRAADQTTFSVGPNVAEIVVAQDGIRQRLYGGKITAAPGKALAIPVNPRAYGKSPREFGALELVRTGPPGVGNAVLVLPAELVITAGGKKRRGAPKATATPITKRKLPGEVMYLLTRSVDQKADPSVMPDDDTILAAAAEGLATFADDDTGGRP
jgi:hypothetical protein